jgi:mycothiol synthase
VEGWVDLYNQSFVDHWDYHPMTIENREHWLTDPGYMADLDLVAVAPDGTFAALCSCEINAESNERDRRKEGLVDLLGTRRGHRRLGLGRAMLLEGLSRLKSAGMDTARIGVDATNPTGALGLYESVGFRKAITNVAYNKDL